MQNLVKSYLAPFLSCAGYMCENTKISNQERDTSNSKLKASIQQAHAIQIALNNISLFI